MNINKMMEFDTENLSTFSSHIKNVLSILSEIDENSFVIMDELGSGTPRV